MMQAAKTKFRSDRFSQECGLVSHITDTIVLRTQWPFGQAGHDLLVTQLGNEEATVNSHVLVNSGDILEIRLCIAHRGRENEEHPAFKVLRTT